MKINRLGIFFAVAFFMLTSVHAQAKCNILYGEEWAFGFLTPNTWSSYCRAEEKYGVPVAFWPTGSSFENSPAVMYINVSLKKNRSLPDFVRESQTQFRVQAPKVVFVPLEFKAKPKLQAQHFSVRGDPGGNVEHIAYIDGPTAFFIMALSARDAKALESGEPAFKELYESFFPMSATIKK